MSNIQIKILNNEEFDGLSHAETRGADISDSLGFADVHSGKVYVRNTGVDDLNKYLINHEVSHLFEEHGTDEDPHVPGIRHKKVFKEIIAPLTTGFNLETGKFSPAGILDPTITKSAQEKKEAAKMSQGPLGAFSTSGAQGNNFGNASAGGGGSAPAQGSAGNVGGSLNTGIGSSGVNQGIDPNLAERVRGFYSGRPTF